jgi:hypothetical protein
MRRAPWLLLAVAAVPLIEGACRPPESPIAPVVIVPPPTASSAPCEPRAAEAYRPLPAASVSAAFVPDLTASLTRPERVGEDFTVWGLKKALRLPGGAGRLAGRDVAVVGLVVATNFAEAPACALHAVGHGDPPGCNSPIPAFFLADEAGETHYRLKVMGFAANWATMFSAAAHDKAHRPGDFRDPRWDRPVPLPLPAPGARLRVVGRMGTAFELDSSGTEVYPAGVLTFRESRQLAPGPVPAVLGQRR